MDTRDSDSRWPPKLGRHGLSHARRARSPEPPRTGALYCYKTYSNGRQGRQTLLWSRRVWQGRDVYA